ncbi:MAG: ABC transporter permease subunit [Anaerolineales bacterium]|nr:ABC transporter permease subunit [Anaerolineales bacterium]
MFVLIIRRLILALITLFIISLIVFIGVEALPGDSATGYLGQLATPESLAALREEFGLNDPVVQRYFDWLGDILKGDLGVSMVKRKPVAELIGNRFRNTIVLAMAAALVGIPLAIVLGVIAGLMRDKWPDILVSTASIIAMTLPGFVTATLLIYVFAIRLEMFPAITLLPTNVPVVELLPNIVLPIITLTLIMVAHILRLVRTNMIDVMTSDYVQMARLKGVPTRQIVFKHALPNAMLPTINVVALTLAWLLGGVAIIETVFNYPGIGKLMIGAITDRDFALVQGIAIILSAVFIALNLIADLLSMILNPKLRTARGH